MILVFGTTLEATCICTGLVLGEVDAAALDTIIVLTAATNVTLFLGAVQVVMAKDAVDQ